MTAAASQKQKEVDAQVQALTVGLWRRPVIYLYFLHQTERDRLQQTLSDLKHGDKHALSKMEMNMHNMQAKVIYQSWSIPSLTYPSSLRRRQPGTSSSQSQSSLKASCRRRRIKPRRSCLSFKTNKNSTPNCTHS